MAKRKTAAKRPKASSEPPQATATGQRVEVATNLKDISVGKKGATVHLESFKVSMKESIQINRWIDSEERVIVSFDDSIVSATILTESKVCKNSNLPKLNGLKLSSNQVAEMTRILQSESGAVNVVIVPDTLGLYQKQMDAEDGLGDEPEDGGGQLPLKDED